MWTELKKAAHSCSNGVVNSPVIQRDRRCATIHEAVTVCLSNLVFQDELDELVHDGAQKIIRQAVEAGL